MSGALEARLILDRLSGTKTALQDLCLGGPHGLVNPGRIKRLWVDDESYGVRFLSSTDILRADLSDLQLISKKAVRANPKLLIGAGWTLITRAGTIGRMAFARRDMDGLACSEDVLRVIPDAGKILPGYLYAYLSSKFGVPLVVGGTYGAIIQHIEPEHIAELPVPRLGDQVESAAHTLIAEAATLRASASKARREAIGRVEASLKWTRRISSNIAVAISSSLQGRMDAYYHSPAVVRARQSLARHAAARLSTNVESVFEPNRGPRLKVDDLTFGIPFLSSSEVFRLDPVGEYSISKRRTPHLDQLLVSDRDLLLPRSGQIGGIIGRAVLPLPTYYGHAASEHLVRVRCRSRSDAFFLWAVFASEPGYLATVGTAFGTSIPSLDCDLIANTLVPWFDDTARLELAARVAASVEANTRAIYAERKAVRLVEEAIEKGVD